MPRLLRAPRGLIVAIFALLLSAAPASAQYVWSTSTTTNTWLTPTNWTGGTAGTFPGLSSNGGIGNGGPSDTATFGTLAAGLNAANGIGIDFSAAGANGLLQLGGIDFGSATANLQLGSSSGTGTLALSGSASPIGGFATNVLIGNTSATRDFTVAPASSGTLGTMALRLDIGNGIFVVSNAARTLTISSIITETINAGSGFRKEGPGTLVLSGANSFTGSAAVNGGTLSISADNNLGTAPGAATAGKIVLSTGTLLATSTFTLNANRGIAVGTGVAGTAGTINVASGQTLTYNGIIANNGAVNEQLNKIGAGTLVLGGPSTYAGGTLLTNGTIILNNLGGLGSGGQQTMAPAGANDGALLINTTGTFARVVATGLSGDTGTGRLVIGSQTGVSGDVSFSSNPLFVRRAFTIQAGATRTIFSGEFRQGGATIAHITISSPVAGTLGAQKVVFTNPGTASTFGNITIGDSFGPNAVLQFGNGSGSGSIVPDSSNISFFAAPGGGNGGSQLLFAPSGATGETVGALISLAPGAGNITTISGTASPVYTLTIGGGNQSGDYSGTIGEKAAGATSASVAIVKIGNGTQTFSGAANTYTGTTTINGGVLAVAALNNGGVASSIGASDNTAGNLVIDGGTLRYTGGGSSTDRLFTLGSGATGGALDASGTGAVNFTNTGSMAFAGTTARTLTLTGSNTGLNTLAAVIGDVSGGNATSVTKTGTGTWALTGTNTYTGATTVSGGTLLVNGSTASGSAVTVTNTGSVLGGIGNIGGSVTITNNGAIRGGDASGVGTTTIAGNLTLDTNAQQIFRITAAGAAAPTTTGGSSIGAAPNPTNNNFVDINGSLLPTSLAATATYHFTVDGTGVISDGNLGYSYQVGRFTGPDLAGLGAFTISDQSQFTQIGFSQARTFTLTGDGLGNIYLNLAPVPEPATALGLAAGVLGLGGFVRRRLRREV